MALAAKSKSYKTDTSKQYNIWLKDISNTPKIGNYAALVIAETNGITKQKNLVIYIWVCLVHAKKLAWAKFGSCDFEFA